MLNNATFEAFTKSFQANAQKFNPAAAQDAFKPVMESLQAWGELAQKQAQTAQAALAESMESYKSVKEPQAAFEAMKASAEKGVAIASQNFREVTAMGVAQFNLGIAAVEKANPAPEAFANISKSLKHAASTMEAAVESALRSGSNAVSTATTAVKRSRAA